MSDILWTEKKLINCKRVDLKHIEVQSIPYEIASLLLAAARKQIQLPQCWSTTVTQLLRNNISTVAPKAVLSLLFL